jgi:hypothetical protein
MKSANSAFPSAPSEAVLRDLILKARSLGFLQNSGTVEKSLHKESNFVRLFHSSGLNVTDGKNVYLLVLSFQ